MLTTGEVSLGLLFAALGVGATSGLSAQATLLLGLGLLFLFAVAVALLSRGTLASSDPPAKVADAWRRGMGDLQLVRRAARCASVSLRRDASDRAVAEWMRCGIFPLLCASLGAHPEDDACLGSCLSIMTTLSKREASKAAIMGDVDFVEEGADADGASEAVADADGAAEIGDSPLQLALRCVERSLELAKEREGCPADDADRCSPLAEGAASPEPSAREALLSNGALVQQRAGVLFASLADDDAEGAAEMVDAGCMDALLGAMAWFRRHSGVQQWCCVALFNLTFGHAANKVFFVRRGGIRRVVAALREHGGHMELQRQGIATLYGVLQGTEDTRIDVGTMRAAAFAEGLLPVLRAARSAHAGNAEIAAMAAQLIAAAERARRAADDGFEGAGRPLGEGKEDKEEGAAPRGAAGALAAVDG